MKTAKKKKRVDPRAKPAPPRFNPRVMRGKFFLRIENINPSHQKVQVMWVNPTGSTRFTISTISNLKNQATNKTNYQLALEQGWAIDKYFKSIAIQNVHQGGVYIRKLCTFSKNFQCMIFLEEFSKQLVRYMENTCESKRKIPKLLSCFTD